MAVTEQVQKVLSGGRITISEEAREKLKIESGDYVIVKVEDGIFKVIPAKVIANTRSRETKK